MNYQTFLVNILKLQHSNPIQLIVFLQKLFIVQQIKLIMSKPIIKFVYTGQFRSQVHQIQKGPAKLQNLYDSILHPQYEQITYDDIAKVPSSNIPQISNVEVNSKPASRSSMNRYKSAQSLYVLPQQNKTVKEYSPKEKHQPIINVEAIRQSQFNAVPSKKIDLKKTSSKVINDSKPDSILLQTFQQDKIVLKAPSYRLNPVDTNEDNTHASRKQIFKAENNTKKYIYKGIPTKNQGDFVSCFGCFDPKAKSYQNNQRL